MEEQKWWRVVAPDNILFGADVRGNVIPADDGCEVATLFVRAIRRVDMIVGDRPFQVQNLGTGIMIEVNMDNLELSPVQDEVVEISRKSPHGEFQHETTETNGNRHLTIVWYEDAIQIAVTEERGYTELTLATNTWMTSDSTERLHITEFATSLFREGAIDELIASIKRGDL